MHAWKEDSTAVFCQANAAVLHSSTLFTDTLKGI